MSLESAESAGLAEDLAAFGDGAALIECAYVLVSLSGPDRLRLLHGLVTADVKGLAPGATAGGFFTTGQGRILADFRLLAFAESSWLLLPPGTGEPIRVHLEKYRLASQVEISAISDRRIFELRGPLAAFAAGTARAFSEKGVEAVVAIDNGANGSQFFLLLQASEADEYLTAWLRSANAPPLRRVGALASEMARVEGGELRFGVDFSSDNFPQETGREPDISYTKGCYLGQEVVARIHYRGGVRRLPRGLRFAGATPPAAGAELLFEGRAVGRATSVARSPRFGAIGLGLVHQRGCALGTRLEVAGGGSGEVVALPFAAATRATG